VDSQGLEAEKLKLAGMSDSSLSTKLWCNRIAWRRCSVTDNRYYYITFFNLPRPATATATTTATA